MGAWLALLALSCSWLFGEHVYMRPDPLAYGLLLATGVVLFAAALRNTAEVPAPPTRWLLVPLLVAALVLPFPYRVGPTLAAAASAVGGRRRALQRLVGGVWSAGLVLTVQAAVAPIYFAVSASHKEIPWIAPPVAALLDFFGLAAASDRTTVIVQTMRQLYFIPATWEHLALYPLALFLVGAATLQQLGSGTRHASRLVGTVVGYGLLRFALVILALVFSMLFVEYEKDVSHAYFFWTPWIIAVSLLPLPVLVGLVMPAPGTVASVCAGGRTSPRAVAIAAVGLFLLVVAVGFQDPGARKDGRLLIDEGHSEWERTTRKYDTTWYGQESGYNYAAIADFLGYYYQVDRSFGPLTADVLRDTDVLMLKIPTAPFSADERRAIGEFVRVGGGLLLLGEHTNVFGSGSFLNPIAREFGLSFRFDAIFDIEKTFVQLYEPPQWLPHPIVQHMPPFLFATSCSIEPLTWRAEPVILSTGLKSLDIDYASRNFYPQVKDATEMRIGPFHQMMAVKAGRGRVAAFSDSTCFSNFSAFTPGKPELMLASLDWLNRRNRFAGLNVFFLALAGALFAAALVRSRHAQWSPPHVIAWGAGTLAVALVVVTAFNRMTYPLPRPHTEPVRVAFERAHSDYDLPVEGFTEQFDRSFAIFYQWVLRVGYFPLAVPTLQEALQHGTITVIIDPVRPFSPHDTEAIRAYLVNGGKLLVLDSPGNQHSTANQILAAFGMSMVRNQPLGPGALRNGGETDLALVSGGLPIDGGESVLTLDGRPVLARQTVGKGALAAFSAAQQFVDSNMGVNESTTPDDELLQTFALEFALLRGLVQDDLAEELSRNEPDAAPE